MHLLRESSRWNGLVLSVLVSMASGCDGRAREQLAAEQAAASRAKGEENEMRERLSALTRESEAKLASARTEEERARIREEAAAARQSIQSSRIRAATRRYGGARTSRGGASRRGEASCPGLPFATQHFRQPARWADGW